VHEEDAGTSTWIQIVFFLVLIGDQAKRPSNDAPPQVGNTEKTIFGAWTLKGHPWPDDNTAESILSPDEADTHTMVCTCQRCWGYPGMSTLSQAVRCKSIFIRHYMIHVEEESAVRFRYMWRRSQHLSAVSQKL